MAIVANRRIIGAAVGGVLLTAIVAIVVARQAKNSNDARDRVALHDLVARTVPGMCSMQQHLNAHDRGAAANVFWDEVHSGAHVLSADLNAKESQELAPFVRAMTQVEEDLRTLAPTLAEHADGFSRQLRLAVTSYDPTLWKPC